MSETRTRKKVSQREAARLRREVRELRHFVARIKGAYPSHDHAIMQVGGLDERWRTKAEGISWGARQEVVIHARFEGANLYVYATRTPERRSKS